MGDPADMEKMRPAEQQAPVMYAARKKRPPAGRAPRRMAAYFTDGCVRMERTCSISCWLALAAGT